MASTNDDASGIILVAVGLLAFFWWNGNKTATAGVIGSTAGTGSGKGSHKGCRSCKSANAGAAITTGGTQQPLSLGAAGGTAGVLPGLPGRGSILVATNQPKNAPGANRTGAGSGAQWTGLNHSQAVGTTPRNVPNGPQNPASAGVWVGNTTVTRVVR